MRAQLQYRLPRAPELPTICLAIVCVSFPSLLPLSCLTLPLFVMDTKMRGISGRWGGVLIAEVPITCLGMR